MAEGDTLFDGISLSPSVALWRLERGAVALLSDDAKRASSGDLNGAAYKNAVLAEGGPLCVGGTESCPSFAVFWEETGCPSSSVDAACASLFVVAEAKESARIAPPGRCCVVGSVFTVIEGARDEDSPSVCAFLRGTGGVSSAVGGRDGLGKVVPSDEEAAASNEILVNGDKFFLTFARVPWARVVPVVAAGREPVVVDTGRG